MSVFPTLDELLAHEWVVWALPWVQAATICVVGWLIARTLAGAVSRLAEQRTSPQVALVTRRGVYWGVLCVAIASAMAELGFELSVFLGAAGLLTVAIGFASQTSASNLISGLFLLGERPFVVGDVIEVGSHTGEVVSIDLLSVKLRTFDNLLVRVPNESLLKTELLNLTHFPIRRFDLPVRVPFETDLDELTQLLTRVADAHPLALDEPRPVVHFVRFGDHGVELRYSVWASQARWIELKNDLPLRLKRALDTAGVSIPVPQLQLTRDERSRPQPP